MPFDLLTADVADPDNPRIETCTRVDECDGCIFVFNPARCYQCSKQTEQEAIDYLAETYLEV